MHAHLDQRSFRTAMGRFPTGVTVVTTAVEGRVHGMTASSFLSVSLDPPLVLISIGHHTRMHGLLACGQPFGISVLAAGQQCVSDQFAGRGAGLPLCDWIWEGEAPLLPGAVAHVAARIVAAHCAGDHTLFIGGVEHLRQWDGEPLVAHCGRYRWLAAEQERPQGS